MALARESPPNGGGTGCLNDRLLRVEEFSVIEIEVKFYGGLHTRYPDVPLGQALAYQVEPGTTIEQLLTNQLDLSLGEVAITLINGKRQDPTYPLQNGDLLALFPPIGGGCI